MYKTSDCLKEKDRAVCRLSWRVVVLVDIDLYTEQATMEAGWPSIAWSHAFTDVSFY